MPILIPQLMRYNLLVVGSDDFDYLSSRSYLENEKKTRLLNMAESGGYNGYFVLYICLRETKGDSRGHGDAVDLLEKCGMNGYTFIFRMYCVEEFLTLEHIFLCSGVDFICSSLIFVSFSQCFVDKTAIFQWCVHCD